MDARKASINEIQDHPDNESNVEENQKKLKYPKAVFFIISNEFCERFSFYGIRVVLTLYLQNYLLYSPNMATSIYHVFTMFAYFFPVFGAILADSFLGKFRTIFYLSIIYALGQILLTLSAAPIIGLPPRECSLVGLLLIAVGTGGIKTCVAAFGGDQFVLPQQERYLSTFFSLFYFSINSGSLISSFLTPLLRSDVSCFGDNSCYSLAFLIPAILMVLSIVIFLLGKPLYKIMEPKGNVIVNVSKCVCHAVNKKFFNSSGRKKEHWLDYADDEYEQELINDIKAAFQVMKLFLPIPIFWALFDQQGTRWTIQATKMNGQIGSFIIQPDQMQVVNPFLVLAFIPLFETCVYPLLDKIGLQTPLRKLTIGGLLAALAFVASALVELELEKTNPVLPSPGVAQLRLFNTLNCPVDMQIADEHRFVLKGLEMWQNKSIPVKETKRLSYVADYSRCSNIVNLNATTEGTITVEESLAKSWVITPEGLSYEYRDSVEKLTTGDAAVRGLIYVNSPGKSVSIEFVKGDTAAFNLPINSTSFRETERLKVKSNTYDIYMGGKLVKSNVHFGIAGVYTLVGYVNENGQDLNVITVTEPNSMHLLWLLPQYILLTMGEVMFSVTGLEFAFTQAPISMKSLLQATWLLTTAFGNLIVVIITEAGGDTFFSRAFYELLLYAGLMFLAITIFAVMAKFYKYVEIPEEDSVTEEIHMDVKNGTVNESYKDDEK